MQTIIAVVVGLVLSALVVAEPLVEGQVRLSSGEPVEAAQVLVFDWTNLQRGAVAQATTDATGYFALPLASLGGSVLPQKWTLGQNYPNPFNPSTLIPYHVPTAARVRLEVFNVLGQRVATLVDEERLAGVHTAAWNATDAAGRAVGSGVYFYRLSSVGQPTLTRRMVLIDGQAGQAAARVPQPTDPSAAPAAEGVYGLAVTGAGFVTYVDASFGVRAGMAPVEVVVDAVDGLPRGKALTDRVLGDVNGDGQVTLDDALLVTTYVVEGSVALPPNGDISLGDVNGDGQVNLADAQLLTAYVANPADPSLPAGIGQVVSGSGEAWVAGAIRRLTHHSEGDWSPSWSPDGRHIAFESYRDGNGEIYVMGSDGSNLRRLTYHSESDMFPSWSPDGRHIAFASWRDDRYGEVYVMGSDGSNLRRLTYHSATNRGPSWSPDGRHIAFESYRDGNWEIYVMDSDGSNLRRLTYHSEWDGSPSWSPDGRHIAFESYRDGNWEIYVMGSDGSNLRRLTNHWAGDRYPSWSPDGRHIAFSSKRGYNNYWNIYVIGSDGRNPYRLTGHSADHWYPSWSPDGRHITFSSNRDGNAEIYMMELRQAGRGDAPATAIALAVGESIEGDLSADDSDYFRVTLSSSGTLVASTSGSTDTYGSIEDNSGNILNYNDQGGEGNNFLVSAVVGPGTYYIRVRGYDDSNTGAYTLTIQMEEGFDGSGENRIRRLTTNWTNDMSPSWSPDGRHIAFVSERDSDGDREIYVIGSDGSNPRRLTNHWNGDYSPTWSPDGRRIAFNSFRDDDNFEIYVIGSDGSNLRRLTNHWAYDGSPSWSPDGRHIAFVSNRDDNGEIYVMGSDGSNPRNLTNHSAVDWSPSWSPDSRHIAFESNRDGNWEIYVIGSDGSNPRRLTDNSANDGSPSWSPDGRHIAFVSNRDDNFEIYVIGSDGSNPRRLTNHWANDGEPSWSPAGRHITFQSNRDGNPEIYVMDLESGIGETPLGEGDSPATESPDEVVIPDAALRALIEKALNKTPGAEITQAEMNTLESLQDREALGILSLSGLETATNLQYLSLNSNAISDLRPLANLDKLEVLHLDSNEVSDIRPLANLTQLQILRLASNAISDIRPLADLDKLLHLYLNSNEVSDLRPLANLDKLQVLSLDSNTISDLRPLADLTQLRGLFLASNEISDLRPLTTLTHLVRLYVRYNFLSAASIYEHIPALQSRGVEVEFSSSHLFTERESPFDIELVFLDDFTVEQQQLLRRVAERWASAIQMELPDYEFSTERSATCGDHSIRIPTGEQIDDLRIYMTKFDEITPSGQRVRGYGGPRLLRPSSMPILGCIGIEQEISTRVYDLWNTGLHEIGHVLGIGTIWQDSGMLRGLNADAHFAGPQAIAAFDQAGGTNYRGAKVPTEQDGVHWRSNILSDELMVPSGNERIFSAITLGALSDLGYSVDFSAANPYVLPSPTAAKPVADAVPLCSLEGLPPPVYVND